MKRIVITITLLLLCSASIFAQEEIKVSADSTKAKPKITWFYGGKVAFNTYNYNYSVGTDSYSERINTFGISPKGGFFINDKMLVGLAVWFNTTMEGIPSFVTSIKELEEFLKKNPNPRTVSNSLLIAPHFRYKFFSLWEDRLDLWGEFRPYYSLGWVKSNIFTNVIPVHQYGFRLGPVIGINITPKMSLETSFDLCAIGWQGSSINGTVEYTEGGVQKSLPLKYNDSNFGLSYGFNVNTLLNAIISIGIIKRF